MLAGYAFCRLDWKPLLCLPVRPIVDGLRRHVENLRHLTDPDHKAAWVLTLK